MPRKILLADDSITIHKVIGLTLSREGFEIVTADEGTEALRMAREIRPDIVMADVALPGKNGYEITEAIKKDPVLKDTPVLLLAGTFEPLDAEEAERVRADDHLVKPFESRVLVEKVKALLALYGRREEEEAPAAEPPQKPPLETWEEGNFLGFEEKFEEGKAPQPEPEVPEFGFIEFKAPEAEKAAPAAAQEKKPEEGGWTDFSVDLDEFAAEKAVFEKESFWKEEAWKPEVGKVLEEEEKEEERELREPAKEILGRVQEAFPEAGAQGEEGVAVEAVGFEEAAAGVEEKAGEKIEAAEKPEGEAAPLAALQKEEVREIVERVAREVVRELAKDLVPDLAEKLVAEEVNRIREAIKGSK